MQCVGSCSGQSGLQPTIHARVPGRAGVLKTSNSGELTDAVRVTAAAVCGCGRRALSCGGDGMIGRVD
jgi:hypothetical protein